MRYSTPIERISNIRASGRSPKYFHQDDGKYARVVPHCGRTFVYYSPEQKES